jgi:hypothetical protein
LVGNLIYPCVLFAHGEDFVGKITGMLIEDKNQAHLEKLLTDSKYLSEMAHQAKQLLLSAKPKQV